METLRAYIPRSREHLRQLETPDGSNIAMLQLAQRGYAIQSKFLPDRLGWFSQGSPEDQVVEAISFWFTLITSAISFFSVGIPTFALLYFFGGPEAHYLNYWKLAVIFALSHPFTFLLMWTTVITVREVRKLGKKMKTT